MIADPILENPFLFLFGILVCPSLTIGILLLLMGHPWLAVLAVLVVD